MTLLFLFLILAVLARAWAQNVEVLDSGAAIAFDENTNRTLLNRSYANAFASYNGVYIQNQSGLIDFHLTPENSSALSIIANQTNDNHTGTVALNQLINKGRGLLGDEMIYQPNHVFVYGHWQIWNCGGLDEQTGLVQNTIQRVMENLILVAWEVKNRNIRSSYGYSALFQSSRNRRQIQKIYEQILTGVKVIWKRTWVPAAKANKLPKGPIPIQIHCLRPDVQNTDEIAGYMHCVEDSGLVALWGAGSPVVSLCPRFFTLPASPSKDSCPTFSGDALLNNMDPVQLQLNQEAALVHELAHVYIGHDPAKEVLRLYQAVALSASQQKTNPSNYAYFYSCESLIPVSLLTAMSSARLPRGLW